MSCSVLLRWNCLPHSCAAGYRPLPIFGYLGIVGLFVGTWLAGPIAVPVALLMTTVAVFLFYATVPGRRAVVDNASLTVAVTAWIGGFGAFAFDLLGSDQYQWLVFALVVTVAAMDIGSYFVGRKIGKRPLAPSVSPKKTVEGYVAGLITAVAVGRGLRLGAAVRSRATACSSGRLSPLSARSAISPFRW